MEQRYQAVLAVIRDGVPVVEVASRFGVSRQAVAPLVASVRGPGSGRGWSTARIDRPGAPHQMDPVDRGLGPGDASAQSRLGATPARPRGRQGAAWIRVPSRSGIYRALEAGRADRSRGPTPAAIASSRRWERGGAMELWQMDVMGGVLLQNGTRAQGASPGSMTTPGS